MSMEKSRMILKHNPPETPNYLQYCHIQSTALWYIYIYIYIYIYTYTYTWPTPLHTLPRFYEALRGGQYDLSTTSNHLMKQFKTRG